MLRSPAIPHIARALVGAAAAAVLLLLPAAAQARDGREVARVSDLIDASAREGRSAEETGAALAAFGPSCVPALLDVHEQGATEQVSPGGLRTLRPLEDDSRRALEIALRTFPWEDVESTLRARLETSPTTVRSAHSMEVVGAVCPPDRIAALASFALVGERGVPRSLREPFQAALDLALDRAPAAHGHVRDLYRALDPSLLAPLAELLGERGDVQAVDALVSVIGLEPTADPIVLVQIAEAAKDMPRPAPDALLDAFRPTLDRTERTVRQEAVKAVGRMDDVRAIPRLIELLDDGDRGTRSASQRALERISGERLGTRSEAWRSWYGGAQRWLREEFPDLQAALRGGTNEAATRALLRMARYRVFRHELVDHVARAMSGASEHVSVVACAVLGHLATPASSPPS